MAAGENRSVFSKIVFYGNWVISVLGFIYWVYQITRSFILYWKHETGEKWGIITLHFLLFVANFLYLLYEVNFYFTPIYFTMLLLTDITGIWCFLLITQNGEDCHKMMSAHSSRFINFMIFTLIFGYFISYFLPDHYGIYCTNSSAPLGPLIFCIYYMLWTVFTVY
jgi:hypothetical protein